jgi:hypothetical protein
VALTPAKGKSNKMSITESQLAAKRAQLDAESAAVDQLLSEAVATKAFGNLPELEARIDRLAEQRAELDEAAARHKAAAQHPLAGGGFAAASLADAEAPSGATRDNGMRLSFTAKMASELAKKSINPETKSLASGSSAVVGVDFQRAPYLEGRPALSLLDVLPVRPHSSPEYAYLRQTTRTNAAAVWTSGVKPTSTYTVTRIAQSLSVVAHLSEPINIYWISDNDSLAGFVQDEMVYGLQSAVQGKILTDIAGTSGIDAQAFSTSIQQSFRKAISRLEKNGYRPAFLAMSVDDWEAVELTFTNVNASVDRSNIPFDAVTRRLYGVPVVVVPAIADGGGYAVAENAVALDIDNLGIQAKWSDTAVTVTSSSAGYSDFEANAQRLRVEGRFGTSVFQPLGVVAVDTAA